MRPPTLVFCSAARNRVVCRQREPLHWSSSVQRQAVPKNIKETEDAIKTLIASTKPATNEVSIFFTIFINFKYDLS